MLIGAVGATDWSDKSGPCVVCMRREREEPLLELHQTKPRNASKLVTEQREGFRCACAASFEAYRELLRQAYASSRRERKGTQQLCAIIRGFWKIRGVLEFGKARLNLLSAPLPSSASTAGTVKATRPIQVRASSEGVGESLGLPLVLPWPPPCPRWRRRLCQRRGVSGVGAAGWTRSPRSRRRAPR